MDAKTVVIVALVVSALLLGGVVASGLRPQPAYGQGGVYSTYQAVTAEVRDDMVQFIILDSASRRLIFYEFNPAGKELRPVDGRQLLADFQRKQ